MRVRRAAFATPHEGCLPSDTLQDDRLGNDAAGLGSGIRAGRHGGEHLDWLGKGFAAEFVDVGTAAWRHRHEAVLAQWGEVVAHEGLTEAGGIGQFTHCVSTLGEQQYELQPIGITEGSQ